MTFLQELSQSILQNSETNFKDTLVVLPNRRARKMLQKELAAALQQPCFSPTILSIDDFIHQLSDYSLADKIQLLTLLFQVYQSFEHGKNESLSQFLSWSESFLHDISEIDMQLADASKIFGNLSDIKELETTFGKEQLSSNQQRYLQFYEKLSELYQQFNQHLDEQKLAYEGKIYRNVAENLLQYAHKFTFKRYIFAGFQTLSPSEMEIMRYFHENHQTEFYFDIDNFYKEAYTPFIDILRNKLRINNFNWIRQDYATIEKRIDIVGASKSMSQILYAIEELNRIEKEEGNLNNTVLVFADESLITPFIHCYDCGKANLTMGYPLAATPAHALLSILLNAVRNSLRFKNIQSQNTFPYYHRDVLSFYRNPLIINYIFPDATTQADFIQNIIRLNSIFFTREEIGYKEFQFPDLSGHAIAVIDHIIGFFKELQCLATAQSQNSIDTYCLELILDKLQQGLRHLQAFEPDKVDFDSAIFIINSLIQGISIPLKGSPSEGLQIMGLLETRTLDFKNVIMLSVNEGILPAGKSNNSLILFDVKRHFGLPTYQEKDSVYGYHFFRLLQRAQQVTLLYNTDSSQSLSEKSRFIQQLDFEIKRQKLSNIRLREFVLPISSHEQAKSHIINIKKTDEIQEKLLKMKFSYSHLFDYINCPLQFYLKHIAKIQAAEDISESVEQKIIGSAIHFILDEVGEKIIQSSNEYSSIFSNTLQNLDAIVEAAMRQAILQDRGEKNTEDSPVLIDLSHGKLYLATEVVKKAIKTYLKALKADMEKYQKAHKVFEIRYTEKEMTCPIQVGEHKLQLKGFADRIDYRNGHITILDYKTGKVDAAGLEYENFEDIFTDTKHKQLLQLLMYGYLYQNGQDKKDATPPPYACGIISFQRLYTGKGCEVYPKFRYEDEEMDSQLMNEEILALFKENLTQLLAEIINQDLTFGQTDDEKHCVYCDYQAICKRQHQNDE